MKNKIKNILIIIFTLFALPIFGQHHALYSQYMFNGLAINPAYAGSSESTQLTALSKWQWVGMENAPATFTFSAHTPLKQKNVGIGLTVVHDQVAVFKQSGIYGSYAYKIPFGQGVLSLGLQAGFSSNNFNLSQLSIRDFNDPNFVNQDIKTISPNFGTGIYYQSERYYVGLSMPQIINHSYTMEKDQLEYNHQVQTYFLSGGFLIDLNQDLKLKPNFLVNVTEGAPLEYDLNVNTLIKDILWVGASVQSLNSLNGIIELQMTDQLRFGYAHNFMINELNVMNYSSHEIMINYDLTFFKNSYSSPRYF
ncbi:MAG: PorP/SprF family type IX secretion system membrane protein [Candidatus Cyclobacteriaceae bacterium M3_2C_046]